MGKRIDDFCRKHPNFGIPHLMKYLTIANIVIWLLSSVNSRILPYMQFNPYYIVHGQIWRVISFVFIPPSSGILAIISFYFYYLIGNTLESNWGTARFTLYFLTGVVLSVIYGFVLFFVFKINMSLTAYYIYLSLFFSFAALYPDMQVLLFFIIPIKMKWLAIADAVLFIYSIITMSPFPAKFLPILAILNIFIFAGDDILALFGLSGRGYRKNAFGGRYGGDYARNDSGRNSASYSGRTDNTINFKKAADKIRRDQSANLYNHKCAVCGKTDTDYPGLEFRFCSRCAGYHCFCSEHINSHIHFTE